MLPVLFKFTFDSGWSQAVLYLLALGLVGYSAFAGWRGADPGKEVQRAAGFVVIGIGLCLFGLHYALPASAFLGGKGEGIPIHTYGLMLATGFISAVTVTARLAQKEWRGEESIKRRDQIFDLAFYVLIAAIVGSRVMYIIANLREYVETPSKFFDLGGGLVFYGGLLGAMGVSIWYARKNKMDFFRLADCAIPTVSLGQAFGRLGCFSAGCCWGGVAKAGTKWAVQFPDGTIAKTIFGTLSHTSSLAFQSMSTDDRWVNPVSGEITHQAVAGAVKMSEWVNLHHHTFAIYPTQLMESIGQFLLFGLFLTLRRYRRFHGQILGMWLMAYACLRSTVEVFRGDTERGTLKHALDWVSSGLGDKVPLEAWWNISLGQFISMCMFSLGVAILVRRGKGKLFAAAPPAGATPAAA
ncbi:MAG: prolipoprotein diacylglyceryl transferase [Myxococcaceae bacterium]